MPPPLLRLAKRLYVLPAQAGEALMQPSRRARRAARREALAAVAQDKKPVTLFLAPEAGLTAFFTAHALLAKTLQESGHAVMLLSCNGALPHCNVKSVFRSSDAACGICRSQAMALGDKYGLPDVPLESLLDTADLQQIETLLAATGGKPWTLVHDGIAFGEFAQGESLRARRKMDIAEFDAADYADLLATVTSALRIYFAIRSLENRFAIAQVVYYGAYGHWNPAVQDVRRRGIGAIQIEHGYNRDIDLRLLNLRPAPTHEQQMVQTTRWPDYRDIPLDPGTVRTVAESGLFRLSNHGGRSTHSPNFIRRDISILEDLGLVPGRKTLVAYSSSADEVSAARHIYRGLGLDYGDGPRPFADSNGWLRALIDWAGTQSDLQLIVRLHPRMAAAPGQPLSVEEQGLRRLLTAIPDNVRIIWPRDKFSSYNLAEVADAVLVSWSTIGLELARFGVPVVAAFSDRGSFPVGSFIGFAQQADTYFTAVRQALDLPASLEAITEAIRWTHFIFLSPTISFAESVPAPDFTGVPDWRMPADRERILSAVIDGKDASQMKMAALPRGPAAAAAERTAVRQVLEYFLIFFLTGQDVPGGRIESVAVSPDRCVSLVWSGRIWRHHSPLAWRLAALWSATAGTTRELEHAGDAPARRKA